jgi:hypothetical protein
MRIRSCAGIIAITVLAGCRSANLSTHPDDAPVVFNNPKFELRFLLPSNWRGYSVLMEQWDNKNYEASADKWRISEHGPIITLRHPNWRLDDPRQDIPILVFTRGQWSALNQGKLWPSKYAGGVFDELSHSRTYVFAISSRYNWDELKGSMEAACVVERNRAIAPPQLYPH